MPKKVEFKGVVEVPDGDFDSTDVRMAIREGTQEAGFHLDEIEAEMQAYSELCDTYTALSRDVLIVVRVGQVDDWAAYVGAVPGVNHGNEEEEVARHGRKLSRDEASFFFPQFDPKKYRK